MCLRARSVATESAVAKRTAPLESKTTAMESGPTPGLASSRPSVTSQPHGSMRLNWPAFTATSALSPALSTVQLGPNWVLDVAGAKSATTSAASKVKLLRELPDIVSSS